MSHNSIILVAVDPLFKPARSTLNDLKNKFLRISKNPKTFNFITFDNIEFFDCGGNFEKIVCPECDADVMADWWAQSMHADYDKENGFQMRKYKLPCCQQLLSLSELKYEFHQAFGCFGIELYEPDYSTINQYQKIAEKTLNISLNTIYRHI